MHTQVADVLRTRLCFFENMCMEPPCPLQMPVFFPNSSAMISLRTHNNSTIPILSHLISPGPCSPPTQSKRPPCLPIDRHTSKLSSTHAVPESMLRHASGTACLQYAGQACAVRMSPTGTNHALPWHTMTPWYRLPDRRVRMSALPCSYHAGQAQEGVGPVYLGKGKQGHGEAGMRQQRTLHPPRGLYLGCIKHDVYLAGTFLERACTWSR